MVFAPAVMLAICFLTATLGFVVAYVGAPRSVTAHLELSPRDPQAWFNISEPFWGSGSLRSTWYGFQGQNSTISVLACGDANCSPNSTDTVYSASADLGYNYARGLTSHTYELNSTGLQAPEAVNLSFDFNWSVFPLVGAWSQLEAIALGVGLGGCCYPVAFAVRVLRS